VPVKSLSALLNNLGFTFAQIVCCISSPCLSLKCDETLLLFRVSSGLKKKQT